MKYIRVAGVKPLTVSGKEGNMNKFMYARGNKKRKLIKRGK